LATNVLVEPFPSKALDFFPIRIQLMFPWPLRSAKLYTSSFSIVPLLIHFSGLGKRRRHQASRNGNNTQLISDDYNYRLTTIILPG
jgi:hypothetical protein